MQEKHVNLLILGGAGSGLVTAARALECGLKDVLILEKNKTVGGCTRVCAGLFGVESRFAKEKGATATADECYKYYMDMHNWQCNGKLVRKWFLNIGKVIDWLQDGGVHFEDVVAFVGVGRYYHICIGAANIDCTGNQIVTTTEAKIRNLGGEIMTSTPAKKLLVENGRVIGAEAVTEDGETLRVYAKAVVITTGSISGNRELCKRFYPDKYWGPEIKVMAGAPFNSGDGLVMAEEIGAYITNKFSSLFLGPVYEGAHIVNYFNKRGEVLKINARGERFTNEDMPCLHDWGWMAGAAVESQPGRRLWGLLDDGVVDYMTVTNRKNLTYIDELSGMGYLNMNKGKLPPEDENDLTAWMKPLREKLHEDAENSDWVCVSDDLDDIAAYIGCDPATLRKTVDDYNSFCDAGYDNEFLKDKRFLIPMRKPPFYCIKSWQGIDTVTGGIMIDKNMQVIDKDYNPIPGLYCAGTAAGAWGIDRYGYWGSNLSFTVFSGYTVGETLADQLKD